MQKRLYLCPIHWLKTSSCEERRDTLHYIIMKQHNDIKTVGIDGWFDQDNEEEIKLCE